MGQMSQEILDRFGEDGIPVMISLESDVRQGHQDFADCSRVRQLPPALLATYDRRNPGNRLFLDLIEQSPIFLNKIESTSKSIAKSSPNVFTANQIKSYVKALLLHSWSGSVEQYEMDVRALFSAAEQQEAKLAEIIAFTRALTDEIPVWKQVAGIPDDKKSKVLDIRAGKYVCLEGEGLVILGCIGYELLTYAPNDWLRYVSALGRINWQESDPIWTSIRQRKDQIDPKTNQTVTVYKKLSAYSAVNAAIESVRSAIGWRKPDPLNADEHSPEALSDTEKKKLNREEKAVASLVALGMSEEDAKLSIARKSQSQTVDTPDPAMIDPEPVESGLELQEAHVASPLQ
jgi:hypothetical protein